MRRNISEALKATKQREPDKNESGTFIFDRSEFAAILGTIRQLIYGDDFKERFEGYFANLSEQKKDRDYQVRQKFYEYKNAGKLKNISEADLETATTYIWGKGALEHTGASQLPYSVDLFKKLLLNANITDSLKMKEELEKLVAKTLPNPKTFRFYNNVFNCYIHHSS